jgi:RND family efflux transporter MFP subunit
MKPQTTEEKPQTPLPDTLETKGKGMKHFTLIILGVGTVMTGLLVMGILPRLHRQGELNAATESIKNDPLVVNTVTPHHAPAQVQLEIPGSIQAIKDTTIYARDNGYLSKMYVDIGDRVHQNQLLAEIDSPETDQQLAQARAHLAQSRSDYLQAVANLTKSRFNLRQVIANANFAQVSAKRWKLLQQDGAVARQDYDEKEASFLSYQANIETARSDIRASQSSVESAMANISANAAQVRQMEAMESFKRITAPFSGVITARNVDFGALITAGSSGSNTVWLYKIAHAQRLRIYVYVPQAYVSSIHTGQSAKILVKEFPNREFIGTVTRTSNSLDSASHTLLTEVQVPNEDLRLMPGMYAQVKFILNRSNTPLIIPANTLVTNSHGAQVAMVDQDGRVSYRTVAVGRDYGTEVEVASGLHGDEQLIVNPTDDVVDGLKVKVQNSK